MKRIIVDITSDLDKIPNIEVLVPLEFAASKTLNEQGFLESLFTKDDRKGAILIFKNFDLAQTQESISKLPLFNYFEDVKYFQVTQHF